jgi:TatD DNase family protein
MFTDTHCHLSKEYYQDIDKVIKDALNNEVTKIITCGCDYKSNLETLEIISRYSNVYGAIGIHPTEVNYIDETINLIEKNILNKKIIAIGEIGLDYHYDNFNKEEEIDVFHKMLKLAEKYNKPVIIHSRDANSDTFNILKQYNLKGVIHSFSGDLELAKKYIDLGYLIGVNGIITFKNADLIKVVKELPIQKILIETDSPYLSPVPFRGEKNEPKNVLEVAKFLSKELNLEMAFLAEILDKNLRQIFDIKP